MKDILVAVKPNLTQSSNSLRKETLQKLHEVAKLADSFTKTRASRAGVDVSALIDQLDLEGVTLWNMSTSLKTNREGFEETFATMRYAGFKLIEAGLDSKPSVDALVNILELSSKVGLAFSATGGPMAEDILTKAASYERTLSEMSDDLVGSHSRNRSRAVVLYYVSRMDAAWRQDNIDVASYMMAKIQDSQIEALSAQDIEVVINKLMEIGKSIMKVTDEASKVSKGEVRAKQAIKWMQRAFTIVERAIKESKASPQQKQSVLKDLGRAYYLSSQSTPENLERAEECIKELCMTLDITNDQTSVEYQRALWMRVAIMKQRNASTDEFIAIFRSITSTCDLGDKAVQEILLELRTLSKDHSDVVTRCHDALLTRAIADITGHHIADKILMSFIIHTKAHSDQNNALRQLRLALNGIATSDTYQLGSVQSTACLTLIWQIGDQCYANKEWEQASEWFLLGVHDAFHEIAYLATSKCLRKAILCHIHERHASVLIDRCPKSEAATCYLAFMVAAHQGQTQEATQAIHMMVKALDFDQKMLLLATNLAREVQNRQLLHTILETLLTNTYHDGVKESASQGMTIVRCLVRLVLQMIEEPTANQKTFFALLSKHFHTAIKLAKDAIAHKDDAVISRDISWLWRTAYNTAVSSLGKWTDGDVTTMFIVARDLMQLCNEIAISDSEPDLLKHQIMASFAAISGQLFAIRQSLSSPEKLEFLRFLLVDLEKLRHLLSSHSTSRSTSVEETVMSSISHLSFIYQIECLAELREWEDLQSCIQGSNYPSDVSIETQEAVADILWSHQGCPVAVLFTCLESILSATTQQGRLSVKKFSRWLRALCTILLSRGKVTDRQKALSYMNQAIDILKTQTEVPDEDRFPLEEKQWLISTAFNTGVECVSSFQTQEAREWYEVAVILCRFTPGSPQEKIQLAYEELLNRHSGVNKPK
ncbi:hypothetical protein CPB86DRAFT_810987 [Serendipita vermifera]|nr:hypothetical protein CPB86DRAFT_810987 [Serendipita vermifera]